jgi:hypothetical protein
MAHAVEMLQHGDPRFAGDTNQVFEQTSIDAAFIGIPAGMCGLRSRLPWWGTLPTSPPIIFLTQYFG